MKRFLIILLLAICGISAKAQIVYDPFIPGQAKQQTQSQTIRTNAYSVDMYGNVEKLPIKVQVESRYNMTSIYIIECYVSDGVYGYWQRLPKVMRAEKCTPAYSQNKLEQQFMYKSMILGNSKYYYFDL